MSNLRSFVVAPSWPGETGGYEIANRSSLEAYVHAGDAVTYIVIDSKPPPPDLAEMYPDVEFQWIPIPQRSLALRFAESLVSPVPGSVIRYRGDAIGRRILEILSGSSGADGSNAGGEDAPRVIFEDLPCSLYVERIRARFPNARFVVRSHNVHADMFDGVLHASNLLMRLPWSLEIARLRSFEEARLREVDKVWTISNTDAQRYSDLYGVAADGVLGVSIDAQHYADVAAGDLHRVLFLGTADVRKAQGLAGFLSRGWPEIRSVHNEAELLLGGRKTENFDDPAGGVRGLGFVDDAERFLGEGTVFVNPQESGSGIKLKSLIAMTTGKTLVSTPVGVEGISGESGVHFFEVDGQEALGRRVAELLDSPERCAEVGANARALVEECYSREGLGRLAGELLAAFDEASRA